MGSYTHLHGVGKEQCSVGIELGLVDLTVWALAVVVEIVEAAILPLELLHKPRVIPSVDLDKTMDTDHTG